MSNPTLQRAAAAPSGSRASSTTISNLLANYGLLFVFLLILLVFGLLRPSSFFQRHEPQCDSGQPIGDGHPGACRHGAARYEAV